MSFLKETEIEKDTTESIEDCEKKKKKNAVNLYALSWWKSLV